MDTLPEEFKNQWSDNDVITSGLSRDAKLILLTARSRPEKWVWRREWILKTFGFGKNKLAEVLKELRDGGHLFYSFKFDENGHFLKKEMVFSVTPIEKKVMALQTDKSEIEQIPETKSHQDVNPIESHLNPRGGNILDYTNNITTNNIDEASIELTPVREDGKILDLDNGFLKPNFEKIPAEMKAFPQWVYWKAVMMDKADKKAAKIPMNDMGAAKSNESKTWMPFSKMPEYKARGMNGISFVLGEKDPFTMIDIDGCVENGKPNQFAKQVINYFDSYTEFSPSGTGVRIIVKGKMTSSLKYPRQNGKPLPIEIYSDRRCTTMTGRVILNKPIEDRQKKLEKIYEKYKPKPKPIPQNIPEKSNGTFTIPKETFPQGMRNNSLAKWAGVICKKVSEENLYWSYLAQVNKQCCDPPISERELQILGQSIWRRRYAA